jgi:hypothetical protein
MARSKAATTKDTTAKAAPKAKPAAKKAAAAKPSAHPSWQDMIKVSIAAVSFIFPVV